MLLNMYLFFEHNMKFDIGLLVSDWLFLTLVHP